jgi:glutathione synthase/RimK-type ligase-like ATP-grasp enzyme
LTHSNFRLRVYPWKEESLGAKALSDGLGAKRLRHAGSTFISRPDDVIINWGASNIENPEFKRAKMINTPTAVDRAANKLEFFKWVSRDAISEHPRIPPFADNLDTALEWVRQGKVVVARTKLRARSGTDIVFFEDADSFVRAPLYTQYIKKKEEYRVHIAFGNVVTVQQKVLRSDRDPKETNFRVRNLANGFVFKRNDLHTPEDVLTQARRAMAASNLHFGAIDVIWNESAGEAYVLEINTAPGIEGTTVSEYVSAFKQELSL